MAVKFGKRYRSKQNEEALSLITVEFDNDHIVDMRTNTNIKLFNRVTAKLDSQFLVDDPAD